jgi:DNA polymerase (family 10)
MAPRKKPAPLRNDQISKLLNIIAAYEEMQGETFRARAYEKASRIIGGLTEGLSEIYRRGGIDAIMQIEGIGEGIAKKIEQAVTEGAIRYMQDIKKKMPVDIEDLVEIEGVGPKTVMTLWRKLKIKNVSDLEKAAKAGKIRKLAHFGEKSEQDILQAIEFFKKSKGRFLLGYVLPQLKEIESKLKSLKDVEKVSIGGSARRMKETIGDADFLVVSKKPESVVKFFTTMSEVEHVYAKGPTKVLVRLRNGIDADMRIVKGKNWGAALQYFTGNKDHNVELRKIAISKGWKLNEYGIFRGSQQIAGDTEEGVYKKLGMQWMPPEMRENRGEIELAKSGKIPKLIDRADLKGDLQMHTKWTDGNNTIREMANEAKKLGLEYICITDHTTSLAFAGGLDEKKLEKQRKEIEKVRKEAKGVKILQGAEVNIMKDGSLDISDAALKKLDVVGASVHSNFNLSREEQTKRITRAMDNPNVDIFFHPTGRLIQKREPYDVDLEQIARHARSTGTVLEIDAFPDRLDLKDEHIRLAKKAGCMFSIDSDAHSTKHLSYLEFGVAQARRGWLESKDVINTLPLDRMLKELK